MKVIKLSQLSTPNYQKIIRRSADGYKQILPQVRQIMDSVRGSGDKVLQKDSSTMLVSKLEIKQAYTQVSKQFLKALTQTIKNITAVHQAQLPVKRDTVIYPETGISVWRVWRPIEKVGLYIPGGKAIYPSSVLMTAIPAQIAGCKEIVICSPTRDNQQIPAPTLVAADMIGLTQIYKLGGPEAIAAMAYGTNTVPKVYKLFGAGNSFVTAAKILASETVAIDMPAGPSEVLIIADDTANPAYIAADLLADAEHGDDSACVLITTSTDIAQNTIVEIKKQLTKLSTASRARESIRRYGLFAVVDSLDQAIDFTNEYAPEHLQIMAKNSSQLVSKITNAGSIFLGNFTTKSSGDYATGANHVLPTGGAAKMYPPLGIDSFGKWMQVQKCTPQGLSSIKATIETLADVEGFPAHKYSSQVRFI